MQKSIKAEYIISLTTFWSSVVLVFLGFYLHSYWACLLFVFILPVMFGAHEATHENIFPYRIENIVVEIHNNFALVVGYGFQIMNFKLLRQSHLKHHALGRYSDGYSPDIVTRKPKISDYLVYYLYLTFLPALQYQIAGFILILIPSKYLPIDFKLELKKDKSPIPFILIQFFCCLFLFGFIYLGGLQKFFIYELFFVFVWSILQNSAHYGLKGINSKTDRVCSNTYYLEKPFKILTFGSTAHLGHHADMETPCLDLYDEEVLKKIEQKLGVEINIKYGIISFIKDVLLQFKGPVNYGQLHTNWIKSSDLFRENDLNQEVEYFYRKGIKRKLRPPLNG